MPALKPYSAGFRNFLIKISGYGEHILEKFDEIRDRINDAADEEHTHESDTEGGKLAHNDALKELDGGAAGEYYHLEESEYDTVTDDVPLNTAHRTSDGSDHSDVVTNSAHVTSTGTSHGYINQDVQSSASPTFAGLTKVGDATNYAEIKADGEINLHGTARVLRDDWIDAGGIKSPGAKPATAIAHGTLETPAWQFGDEGVAGNQESVTFNFKFKNDMDMTVGPTITIGWSADGVSPGVCEWQLEYLYTAVDEDTGAAAQETLTATGTASATADGLIATTITGMDTPGSTDVCCHCRLTRLSAGGNDTIADTVEIHGVCLQYTSSKLGTGL